MEKAEVQSVLGVVSTAKMLTEDILSLDITTNEPFVYAEGQNAQLGAMINGELVQRCFSLAGTMDADSANLARFMIRRMPKGLFTGWLFDRLEDHALVGSEIYLETIPREST